MELGNARHWRPRTDLQFFAVLYAPFLSIVFLAILVGTPTHAAERVSFTRTEILDAIRMVESGDREIVPDGDGGRAIGPYQIHRVYWLDATAFDPELGGDYQDCRKRAYAERVIDAYMRRWAPDAWAARDAEVIARVHNGGPQGHEKQATLPYWNKVQAHLPAQSEPGR